MFSEVLWEKQNLHVHMDLLAQHENKHINVQRNSAGNVLS